MNPTLHTGDGHSVLRLERRLAHPVEKVWRAVTDPAEMRHWFPATVEMDPRAGGAMRFTYPGTTDHTDGVVTELDPPRVFAFTWNGDPMRIELSPLDPDGEGTLLVFTHTFTDRPMAGSFATGWETCLSAMEQALDDPTAEVSIGRPRDYAERHDALVTAFGLGEGTVHDDAEGFTIRFERLLPHPAEKVWAQLTEAAAPAVGGTTPVRLTNGHAPAGALTDVREGEVLEYDWLSGGEPAGRVRWELNGGHPAGTRVVVTQRGPARLAGEHPRALAAWHSHLQRLADDLRGQARRGPEDRAAELAELEKRYAERLEAR